MDGAGRQPSTPPGVPHAAVKRTLGDARRRNPPGSSHQPPVSPDATMGSSIKARANETMEAVTSVAVGARQSIAAGVATAKDAFESIMESPQKLLDTLMPLPHQVQASPPDSVFTSDHRNRDIMEAAKQSFQYRSPQQASKVKLAKDVAQSDVVPPSESEEAEFPWEQAGTATARYRTLNDYQKQFLAKSIKKKEGTKQQSKHSETGAAMTAAKMKSTLTKSPAREPGSQLFQNRGNRASSHLPWPSESEILDNPSKTVVSRVTAEEREEDRARSTQLLNEELNRAERKLAEAPGKGSRGLLGGRVKVFGNLRAFQGVSETEDALEPEQGSQTGFSAKEISDLFGQFEGQVLDIDQGSETAAVRQYPRRKLGQDRATTLLAVANSTHKQSPRSDTYNV